MSRTSPSWSTARQRYIRSPAIRTTISSRCQRLLGRGRPRRSRRAITGSEFQHPTPDGFVGDVEPPLVEELLDVSITQREGQVEPDRVLDDHRRKAVAAVRDFSHRTPATTRVAPKTGRSRDRDRLKPLPSP